MEDIEVTCKEKWQSCKACTACSGFQKILDLKDAGVVIYRHTKRIDEINKSTGNLKSSIKTTDDVFIIHNTKDFKINADDCISEIGDEVRCPRCRELVKRAQKYLKNISSIDKKDVISVCDHCQTKKRSVKYCCECHDVVKKFLLEREKESIGKGQLKAWLTRIQKILAKNEHKTRLKYRTHSALYLNKLYKDDESSARSLEVGPMLEVGVRMTESAELIDKVATKSEDALKSLDSKRTKFKSDLFDKGSFMEIQRHASSSLETYDSTLHKDTGRIKDDLELNSLERLRQKRRRDEEFAQKTAILHRGSPRTLKKYYSDENIFFSLAGYGNLEILKTNFSYVFPKKEREEIKSLRRVKTSAELIEDTQDRLRQRAKMVNDEINRQLPKKTKLTSSQKESAKKIYDERQSSKKAKIEEKEIKSDKDKILKEKKENFPMDRKKKEKEKNEEVQKNLRLQEEKKNAKVEKLKNKEVKPQNKGDSATDNLKKMLEEQAKIKAEALKLKKQQEEENKRMRKEAERKLKSFNEIKVDKKPLTPKHQEEPTNKELDAKQIEIRKPSTDDLILQLVKVKQVEKKRPKNLSEINITPLMVNKHKIHNRKLRNCVICVDSELELDVENIMYEKNKPDEVNELIVGNKIIKSKLPISDKTTAEGKVPALYRTLFTGDVESKEQYEMDEKTLDKKDRSPPTLLLNKHTEQEYPKGVIHYALSDRSFIDKGWTMLPTEKVVRKMNVYRMRPAHPEFDWFDRNKNKRLMQYDTGEKLAEFDDNGRGRWFYRNGRLALDYYDAEEMNAQQRFVIYGSGERDERGRCQPISILATFDYLGNGVVFDHTGKIRLKYNQTEGVVLDRSIGPVSHWKWHSLNDPPVLQQVMIDTQMAHKDPQILKLGGQADDNVRHDNEEMLAIEFDNFIREKSKKMSQKFKPFQIRTKAMKINENFSLKILDQANIYLIFRAGTTHIKMNIGMILDHQEIVDTDTAEVGEVSNNLERFPARTDSLAGLQRSVAHAQRVERLRVEREHRLRHPEPALSADRIIAASSRPLKAQLKVVSSGSTADKDNCYCKCRKPLTSNVYYDTRLVQ